MTGGLESVSGAGLRIALLLGSLGRGGTETQAVSLARGLAESGCHVDLFVMYGDAETLRHRGNDWPVTALLRFGDEDHGGRARDVARGAIGLRRWLAAGRYHVVHSALARAYVAAPLLAPLRHRPRLVAWRRSIAQDAERGAVADTLERWSARWTDALVVNSAAVAQAVAQQERVAARRIHLIHNHLPGNAFQAPASAAHKRCQVVTVANLRRVKRLDVLIDALGILQGQGKSVSAVMLGEGPERANLQRQAAQIGVDVTFAGAVLDPRPWLAAASVFVQTSESEGLSNALLEAMAQQKAIVATSVGGTAEALGDTGVLIPPRAPGTLAAEITRLLDAPDLTQSLGRRARARAYAEFSLDQSVQRHLAVYRGD